MRSIFDIFSAHFHTQKCFSFSMYVEVKLYSEYQKSVIVQLNEIMSLATT